MKRTTALFLGALTCAGAYAQGIETSKMKVTFGPTMTVGGTSGYLGSPSEGLLQLGYSYSSMDFTKLNSTWNSIGNEHVDYKNLGSGVWNGGFQKLGNRYIWLYSTWDKKEARERLLIADLDTKTGKAGNGKTVIECNKIESTPLSRPLYYTGYFDKFTHRVTNDKSKILITHRYATKTTVDSRSTDVLGFNVFDSELKLLWKKDVNMPYNEEKMDNEEVLVDAGGNAYLLAKVYNNTRKEMDKGGVPGYRLEVLKYLKGTGELKKIPIKLDKYFVDDVKMLELPDGKIVVTGFYSNLPKLKSVNGVFMVKIDADGNLIKVNDGYYEFPDEVLRQNVSYADVKKTEGSDAEIKTLKENKTMVGSDNSVMVSGEVYYTAGSNPTEYYYQDIMALCINADGKLKWCHKIPKNQLGYSITTFSYSAVPHNGNYFFFYTDNIKNMNLGPNDKPSRHRDGAGGFLVYTKIDNNGKATKAKVYDYKAKSAIIDPYRFELVDEHTILTRTAEGAIKNIAIDLRD